LLERLILEAERCPLILPFWLFQFGRSACLEWCLLLPIFEANNRVITPLIEKLSIFETNRILVDMDSQKIKARKLETAEISLELDLKRAARQLAEQLEFVIVSNYTRVL